jgi:hypothetical protein
VAPAVRQFAGGVTVESGTALPPIRHCRAKLTDLADALDMINQEIAAYLDLETGEILFVSDDARRELEEVYDTLPDDVNSMSDDEQRAAFLAALEEYGPINVEEEELEEADAVERGLGTRFVGLPEADTQASYRDMEAFVETATTPRLQQRLERAIRGRGAFGRFREELSDVPGEEERWYAFKQERLRDRIRAWLEAERIELIDEVS